MRPWSDRGGHDWPARLREDADLRDELEFCERAGIPHSFFLGRVPGAPDDVDEDDWPYGPALWLPADQDKAVAYLRWKRECCSGCGSHPSEWPADPIEAEQDPPYEATHVLCFGCRETSEARKEVKEHAHPMAVRTVLTPRRRDVDKSEEELQDEYEAHVAAGGGW